MIINNDIFFKLRQGFLDAPDEVGNFSKYIKDLFNAEYIGYNHNGAWELMFLTQADEILFLLKMA